MRSGRPALLLVGVAVCSTVLGVGLAWLVSAYRFPGSRTFGWLLILPLAMPSYILGYLTIATGGRTGPIQDRWRDWFGRDAWFPDLESMRRRDRHVQPRALPVRLPAGPRRAP